jgi:hypothetical protein
MSSTYNHIRSKRREDKRTMEMFVRAEVEHQERLEAASSGRVPVTKVVGHTGASRVLRNTFTKDRDL